VTGIFSKKQKVHKIYKADKIAGEWKKISEVPLCPGDYSAMHPAVSPDGSRLFFASNMPGSFGEYDIYVATIQKNGALGTAMNLGEKVNTYKNELHPNPVADGALVFASDGREGFGGLDVYMVEVGQRKVGLAMNMGNSINSRYDEYSVNLLQKDGSGYVVSNRNGTSGITQNVAFNLNDESPSEKDRDYRFLEAFNTEKQIHYSSSVFEDE
jgi:Tol biopolymer transport system component